MTDPAHGIPMSRRGLLRLASIGSLGAAASLGLASCVAAPPAARLRVAGGEAGGLYEEVATLLADALTPHDVSERSDADR